MQSQFDKLFKKRGGRLDSIPHPYTPMLDFALGIGRNTIEQIRHEHPDLPFAYVDIIDNPTINACSDMNKNGNYFIGIHIGTLIVLQEAFFRMLASKNIFTDIGDTSKEVNPPKIRSLQIDVSL